jgi:hypothetical protein
MDCGAREMAGLNLPLLVVSVGLVGGIESILRAVSVTFTCDLICQVSKEKPKAMEPSRASPASDRHEEWAE